MIPRAKCLCCLRHRIRAHNPVYPGWTGSCGFLFIPHYTAALISANDQSAVSCRAQQFPFSGPTHQQKKELPFRTVSGGKNYDAFRILPLVGLGRCTPKGPNIPYVTFELSETGRSAFFILAAKLKSTGRPVYGRVGYRTHRKHPSFHFTSCCFFKPEKRVEGFSFLFSLVV